jgi:hypothetical protein
LDAALVNAGFAQTPERTLRESVTRRLEKKIVFAESAVEWVWALDEAKRYDNTQTKCHARIWAFPREILHSISGSRAFASWSGECFDKSGNVRLNGAVR